MTQREKSLLKFYAQMTTKTTARTIWLAKRKLILSMTESRAPEDPDADITAER